MQDQVRLINAYALARCAGYKKSSVADKRFTEGFNDAIGRFRSMIHSAPTIDAVPVVRCRDCRYRKDADICPLCNRILRVDENGQMLMALRDGTEDNGFCHKGMKSNS